jgi:hypothetical protein
MPPPHPQFLLTTIETFFLGVAFPYCFPVDEHVGDRVMEPATSELAPSMLSNAELGHLPPAEKEQMSLPRRMPSGSVHSLDSAGAAAPADPDDTAKTVDDEALF